jgi:hypothetical protein
MESRENVDFIEEKLTGFDRFYVASLFFYCFLLFAPTVYAVLPFTGALVNCVRLLIAGVLTLFTLQQAVQRGSVKINRGLLFISFVFVMLSILPTAYHQTTYLLLNEFNSFYLVYMFFLFYKKKYLPPLIGIATVFLFVMLVFSIIGFLYALLGYPPLMSGITEEGRAYYWYLSTGAVDNGIFGNIIRPQGIYDEPGGFSYVICTLCFLRILTKRGDAVTFVLLLLGNITFSMIHMMIFALFIVHLAVKYRMKKVLVLYASAVFAVTALAYMPLREPVNDLLIARFAINKATGNFEGNNRAYLFGNAMQLAKMDNSVLLWGLPRDAEGLTVMDRVWGYGENPLAPALKFGIFVAWLYYFYLVFFALCGVVDKKNFFVYVSIFLMLLQRPEFYRGGPAADLLLLFFTGCEMIRNRIALTRKRTLSGTNIIPVCAEG